MKKYCERCKKEYNGFFDSDRFCSRSCANTRIHSKITKEKISTSVKNSKIFQVRNKKAHPRKKLFCVVCKKETNGYRITCSKECYLQSMIDIGKRNSSKRVLRSKNEIKLFELLSQKFKCFSNQIIVNGWDADIVIPDLKLAILWNGIWHYQKVTKQHSLFQVQNRDYIKCKEFDKVNFNIIFVRDHNNKMTPKKAYNQIVEHISKNEFNLSIF